MFRIFFVFLALSIASPAAFFEAYPGFDELYRRADFVGVVSLKARVPDPNEDQSGIRFGPHRLFQIDSLRVVKGEPIQGKVARLADRRLRHDGDHVVPVPFEDILLPEKRFLVFLRLPLGSDNHYDWDELNVEGAVLAIAPITNLHDIDRLKPVEVFEKVIRDHTAYCRAIYEHAIAQEAIFNKKGQ